MRALRSMPLRLRILWRLAVSAFLPRFALGSLTPYQEFILLGGDHQIWSLRPKAKVLVLGGYTGLSTAMYAKTAERVFSLEPVEQFRLQMEATLDRVANVDVLDFAADKSDGTLSLSLGGDGTSAVRNVGSTLIEVPSRDISAIIEEFGPFELMEVNIEGGEYSVIERLAETDKAKSVDKILVQFHDVGPNSDMLRSSAHRQLSLSHMRVWSYEWVWELWIKL